MDLSDAIYIVGRWDQQEQICDFLRTTAGLSVLFAGECSISGPLRTGAHADNCVSG
ncbi:MAG: hypothetical protein ACREFH_07600 [Stellaceae bacterium]